MPDTDIRSLSAAEVAEVVDWAGAEGWNPGLDDAAAFRSTDPEGFLGLFLDGAMASAISAIAYDQRFGFVGFYMCRPDLRGKGLGRRIWDAGLTRLGGRTIGLDGVVAQQTNYVREGFRLAHRNVRYSGSAAVATPADAALVQITEGTPPRLLDAIAEYDARFFPARREAFVRTWIAPPRRHAVAYLSGASVRGYGVIRACLSGFKIGPLFAEDAQIAEALFAALAARHSGASVTLDLPEPNASAQALAERYGMAPVFETARMYRGTPPSLSLEQIFGITTFELG